MLLRRFFSVFLLLWAFTAVAQQRVLSFEAFNAAVVAYHPVARQAQNLKAQADAVSMLAKGAFDPYVFMESRSKTLAGTSYYNYAEMELKIPVWYGMDIVTGIENISGSNVDPEVTKGASSYLGLQMPLLKNLTLDKRRAAVLQANLLIQQSGYEVRLALNDLLYDAQSAYWQWANAREQFVILENALQNNRSRFELVKTAFRLGDKTAMDTVEALSQLQSIELAWVQAKLELQQQQLTASYYLWNAQGNAVSIADDVTPEAMDPAMAKQSVTFANDSLLSYVSSHPKLQWYTIKLESARIDLRLKKQNMLPSLYLKSNLLSKGYFTGNPLQNAYLQNNQQLGLAFYAPLLQREARGEYKLSKLKLQNTEFESASMQSALTIKIQQYINEASSLKGQLDILERNYAVYSTLLQNETLRYQLGESSLFMVNSREMKALEARQKLVSTRAKYLKNQSGLRWSAGLLQY